MSRVDVVIPCYNYGRYLRGCVASALDQPGVDVRVLVLDDASSDETPAVGAELARHDPRVEFRRHRANRGHIATYNEGLAWSSGDYTLLLSADDLLTPGALVRAASVMDRRPDVVLTIGREIKTPDPRPEEFTPPARYGCRVLTGPEFLESCCRVIENPVSTPSAVVRTAAQHRVGGYRKELPHSGDMEMWLRLAAAGSVAVLDCEQAFYRTHPAAMSVGYRGVPNLVQLRAAYDSFFAAHRGALPDWDWLHRLSRRGLAREFFWLAYELFDRGDVSGCEESLRLARQTFPPLRHSRDWSRLRCKRLLGAGVWGRVRPLVRGLRRRARAAAG
jgi:glycosyltransferase involved in cell wall biosynthesis